MLSLRAIAPIAVPAAKQGRRRDCSQRRKVGLFLALGAGLIAGCATQEVRICTATETAEIYLNGDFIGAGEAVYRPDNAGHFSSVRLGVVFDQDCLVERTIETGFSWPKALIKAAPLAVVGSLLFGAAASADYGEMTEEQADVISWGFLLGPLDIVAGILLSWHSYEYLASYEVLECPSER